jgi:spermidine/putrescine transport system permease protein
MILPLYVALEKMDKSLLDAAGDLYSSRVTAFFRVTFPLSLPGVFAGSLLTFIPAVGDFINAQYLGGPSTTMIGNVIQLEFLQNNDYPEAAALSFILMVAILIGVAVYARVLGAEELTG